MKTKKIKFFLGLLCCLTAASFSGCIPGKNRAVRKAVQVELNQLKSSEARDIANCISTQNLLPASMESDSLSQDIADVFTLFYNDFSFRVKDITVDEDHATARTQIKNLDANTLASDFIASSLQHHIAYGAGLEKHEFSANDSYLLLKDLLQTNKYPTETILVDINLKKTGDTWQVIHTPELDNLLTGNFLSHATDPNLLSPSRIVEIHFDAIKGFNSDQLKKYLCLDKLLDEEEENTYSMEIADAFSQQICRFFDYKITDETINGQEATVQVSVTSADIHSIVDAYQKKLNPWLKTSEALAAGADGRYTKIQEMMLSCIRANETSTTNDISISLLNDGVNWKIQMEPEISHAVLGDIQHAMRSISEMEP